MIAKPDRIFDRDLEWRHLATFASRSGDRPQLGVVSGRRRQGKTYLVEALVRETGGLYFEATQATEAESLRLFADALADHLDTPLPQRFLNWDEAITYLFSVAASGPGPIVIDEFPYLSKASPALPSILQREIDRAGVPRHSDIAPALRLRAIDHGEAARRQRAATRQGEPRADPQAFDYPLAARFWGITDPRLAVLLHSVVGGTPAYRRFTGGDTPADQGGLRRLAAPYRARAGQPPLS